MTVSLNDLSASATRRGIKIATGDIPIDGVWVPEHRLVIINRDINPGSSRYLDVLRHELGHAAGDDVHETLDGHAPTPHRGYQPTDAPATPRRNCRLAAAAVGAAAALAAVTYVAASTPSRPPDVTVTVTVPGPPAAADQAQPAGVPRPTQPTPPTGPHT